MIQDLDRLRIVLRFSASGSYSVVREVLRRKAWSILRAAVSREIYCAFFTFPGWQGPEGMMDFASVWTRFPIADLQTLCLTVQPSPIDEEIADSILDLLPEDLVEQARGRYGPQSLENVDWFRQRLESARACTPLLSFIRECFMDSDLAAGLVMYGDVSDNTPMVVVERGEIPVRFIVHIAAKADMPLLMGAQVSAG